MKINRKYHSHIIISIVIKSLLCIKEWCELNFMVSVQNTQGPLNLLKMTNGRVCHDQAHPGILYGALCSCGLSVLWEKEKATQDIFSILQKPYIDCIIGKILNSIMHGWKELWEFALSFFLAKNSRVLQSSKSSCTVHQTMSYLRHKKLREHLHCRFSKNKEYSKQEFSSI